MSINKNNYEKIISGLKPEGVALVAVSKLKSVSDIKALYDLGQKDFGENYVQEMIEKADALPKDIRWHFIGHLQRNKVKYIVPFVHLIHGVDSQKLLFEIDKQAKKSDRIIDCLLQVHIAREETKFGFDEAELRQLIDTAKKYYDIGSLQNIQIKGLMGMASFSDDEALVRSEFQQLKELFEQLKEFQVSNFKFQILSMGMSADYHLAVKCGSNMVRIGSLLFGARTA